MKYYKFREYVSSKLTAERNIPETFLIAKGFDPSLLSELIRFEDTMILGLKAKYNNAEDVAVEFVESFELEDDDAEK